MTYVTFSWPYLELRLINGSVQVRCLQINIVFLEMLIGLTAFDRNHLGSTVASAFIQKNHLQQEISQLKYCNHANP